jgi:heat shock protein HtpX
MNRTNITLAQQTSPSVPTSYARRMALALIISIGFYALTFLAIAASVALLIWVATTFDRVNVRLLVILGVIPLALIWSLLPRRDKFVPPGPKLDPAEQPALFDAIHTIAKQTGQKPPREVYLLSEVNAFVAERGGIGGVGSKRIMGVGLPLLQALTVTQFMGVLAHEFGHFQGGDTRLGGFIYKVRTAMSRTIENLGNGVLNAPFRWYGNLFLRVTQSISRQQEFEADRLAAQVVGSDVMAMALSNTRRYGAAFDAYWRNEVTPLLSEGFRPPITSGFSSFVQAPEIIRMLDSYSSDAAAEKTDVYDTHPALADRIRAIQMINAPVRENDTQPAITLAKDIDGLEQAMLRGMVNAGTVARLNPITWAEAGAAYRQRWHRTADNFGMLVRGCTTVELFEFVNEPGQPMVDALRAATGDPLLSLIDARNAAQNVAGDLLCLLLESNGWVLDDLLGRAIGFSKDGLNVQPHLLTGEIHSGALSQSQWRERMRELGIAEQRVES